MNKEKYQERRIRWGRGKLGANRPALCFVMEGNYTSWSKLMQQLEGFFSLA